MRHSRTIECYDCNKQVVDLKTHRTVCVGKKTFNNTVECYDCQEQVNNLKLHRKECPKAKPSKVVPNTRDIFFILDVSGSMGGDKLKQAKKAILEISENIPDDDRLSVITFDDDAYFKLKPRANGQLKRQNELQPLMGRIYAQGFTALYDALWLAINQLYDKTRKTLFLVLTDGDDNSSKHKFDEVLRLLSEYPNVELDIIYIGSSEYENEKYAQLVQERGVFKIIEETKIVSKVKRIIKGYYKA